MIKVLELFSGTHSVGKCCKELGWDSLSVDIDGRADINSSILDWNYKVYKKDEFDIIWASPPCATFSALQNTSQKTKQEIEYNMKTKGDPLVLKALEIIDYFKPEYWFIENPATGQLKSRDYMKDILFYDVDYCMYSDWGYRKRTRIWTNKKEFTPKKCKGDNSCGNMVPNIKQTDSINSKYMIHKTDVSTQNNTLDMRYRIPPDLIYSLFLE
tara:strand:+ start:36 stop:674 length:639 start_codon:yes stop_codon:yes gene_type:complete